MAARDAETDGSDSEACPAADLVVRRELALIGASAGVVADSVRHTVDEAQDRLTISFEIETEVPVRPPAVELLRFEPVEFIYEPIRAVGIEPPFVQSGRQDFPGTTGHVNPILPGHPISFCLARAGLQPVYDRFGIEGVMSRLRAWLRDALTGALMADGWDPVPLPLKGRIRHGNADCAYFQELAAGRGERPNFATGVALAQAEEDAIDLLSGELDPERPVRNSALYKAVKLPPGQKQDRFPWVFVWTAGDQAYSEPVFGAWRTYGEMHAALGQIGLAGMLDRAIGAVLANGCDCQHHPGRKSLAIVIGVRRPVEVSRDIFGLSDNPSARRFEIKAFTLEAKITDNILDDETPVRLVASHPRTSAALFRWVSGAPEIGKVGMLGQGALGSALADHLMRMGAPELVALDNDYVLPHNVARHTADSSNVHRSKVAALEERSRRLAEPGRGTKIVAVRKKLEDLTVEEFSALFGDTALMVDATADERVRGRLTQQGGMYPRQITRVELFHRGRLGVQFVSGPAGNPSLLDLYYLLCREAMGDEAVAGWFMAEHLGEGSPEELQFGFGCTSATTRLANYVIAQHAAAFVPTILEAVRGPTASGIGINRLDENFRPVGWRWVESPAFVEFQPPRAPGWTVHIHPDVVDRIMTLRAASLPAETGGYLYGGWDAALRQMVVLAATDLPPGSSRAEAEVQLGPAGNTALERKLLRKTFGRLRLCGSWHSHPGSSAAMSGKDEATMASFRRADAPNGVPTLFVIAADNGIEPHLDVSQ